MKVYVVTTGVCSYEDDVKVVGVYKTFSDGVQRGMKESIICKDEAKWGDYWYDVEEHDLE